MKTALHVLAIVAVLAVAGCHDSFPPTDPRHTNDTATPALTATRWCLESITSPDSLSVPSVDPALGIYLELDGTGEMRAFGGCNLFSGYYQTAAGGVIHVSSLVGTKIHCQDGATLEALYSTSLLGALTYRLDGTHLTMICSSGTDNASQRMLRFVACKPSPPPPPSSSGSIAGRRWCLQQIRNSYSGNSDVSVNQWVGMYVEFENSGKVDGYTDSCRISGGYTVNGAGLTTWSIGTAPITPNAAAVSDWQQLSGWHVGARFLAALRASVKYRIDDATQILYIFAGDSNASTTIADTLVLTECTPANVDTVFPGMPFQTKIGRLEKVAGEPLSLRIAGGPLEDSRCPSGTQCVQAGRAAVPLYLMLGVVPRNATLATTGEVQTRDSLLYPNMLGNPNYLIQLLSVYPYPLPGVTVQPADYVVNMTVERIP
ncbi:MAG: META domain-containing protein [Bacteroidetes bacterium]|nr:META domain-containing protein [Bacteroidota bacterium]